MRRTAHGSSRSPAISMRTGRISSRRPRPVSGGRCEHVARAGGDDHGSWPAASPPRSSSADFSGRRRPGGPATADGTASRDAAASSPVAESGARPVPGPDRRRRRGRLDAGRFHGPSRRAVRRRPGRSRVHRRRAAHRSFCLRRRVGLPGGLLETADAQFPPGVVDLPAEERSVTLLDEFGGAAVLRAEAAGANHSARGHRACRRPMAAARRVRRRAAVTSDQIPSWPSNAASSRRFFTALRKRAASAPSTMRWS